MNLFILYLFIKIKGLYKLRFYFILKNKITDHLMPRLFIFIILYLIKILLLFLLSVIIFFFLLLLIIYYFLFAQTKFTIKIKLRLSVCDNK